MEGDRHLSKGRLCPAPATPATQPTGEGENFYRQSVGGWLHAETAQSCLTVIFKLVITGLTTIILVVLGTVNL